MFACTLTSLSEIIKTEETELPPPFPRYICSTDIAQINNVTYVLMLLLPSNGPFFILNNVPTTL